MSMTARPTPRSDWVGVHEAAALMGVSPATLRRWSDAGDIDAFTTPGGHRRFSRSAIAGMLAADHLGPPTPDDLDRVRARLTRAIRRSSRRLAGERPWATAFDADDRADIALQGRRIVDGLLAAIDERTGPGGIHGAATSHAAAVCGELAARRGIHLGELITAGLRLDAAIVHELALAARRLDLDGPTTARWLDLAASMLDLLLGDAMGGHASVRVASSSPDFPGWDAITGRRAGATARQAGRRAGR